MADTLWTQSDLNQNAALNHLRAEVKTLKTRMEKLEHTIQEMKGKFLKNNLLARVEALETR